MRTIFSSAFLLGSIFLAGGLAQSQHPPRPPHPPAVWPTAAPAVPSGEVRCPSWPAVVGTWQVSPDEAKKAAKREGQRLVEAYFRDQGLDSAGVVTDANFDKKCRVTHKNDEDRDFPDLGRKMYQSTYEVELPSQVVQEVLRTNRERRSGERMLVLFKLTGGILLLLGIVAAYFRLEDATKGYYSNWLRLAAAVSGSAVVAGVVLLLA
jgi:hypothetical protein